MSLVSLRSNLDSSRLDEVTDHVLLYELLHQNRIEDIQQELVHEVTKFLRLLEVPHRTASAHAVRFLGNPHFLDFYLRNNGYGDQGVLANRLTPDVKVIMNLFLALFMGTKFQPLVDLITLAPGSEVTALFLNTMSIIFYTGPGLPPCLRPAFKHSRQQLITDSSNAANSIYMLLCSVQPDLSATDWGKIEQLNRYASQFSIETKQLTDEGITEFLVYVSSVRDNLRVLRRELHQLRIPRVSRCATQIEQLLDSAEMLRNYEDYKFSSKLKEEYLQLLRKYRKES